jgi:signal transduction histidine kinase
VSPPTLSPPAHGGAPLEGGAAGARRGRDGVRDPDREEERDGTSALGLLGRFPPVVWLARHPSVADVLLAVAYLGPAFASLNPHTRVAGYRDADALAWTLQGLIALALVWRRRSPIAVLLAVVGLATAYHAFGYPPGPATIAVGIAIGTVAAREPRRVSLWLLALSGVAAVADGFGHFVGNSVVLVAAWALGDNLRTRRAYVRALEERAARLEADRDQRVREATRAERARIARELHDVVAHHVSVMVVQAGGARRSLDRSPDRARDALATIEETGRDALNEMRRLLGMLREAIGEDEGRTPQPRVRELGRLVDQMRDAGLHVDLRVDGDPDGVPPGVDLSVYRIVQEALTNTLKHAGPARAHVRIGYSKDRVDIEVVDDGRGAAANASVRQTHDGGHGLVGMRERVAIFGGDVKVGPRQGGGFAVNASLPWRANGR